jgi:hypothetical protein
MSHVLCVLKVVPYILEVVKDMQHVPYVLEAMHLWY